MSLASEGVESPVTERKLLDGWITRTQLKAEMRWSDRTTLRREKAGMPVIVIGATKLYPRDRVRAWLLSQIRQREAPQPDHMLSSCQRITEAV